MSVQFQPKRILVTGGAGFIGSHLVVWLCSRFSDYQIYSVDKMDICSSLNNIRAVDHCSNHHFVRGDITSYDFVHYLISEKQIDTIIHVAASTHVDNSFGDSFEFTKNNVLGTHVLLEIARVFGNQVKRFIHVSTDEVYGEASDHQPNCLEESILAPSNPYSATKAAAECMVKAYAKSFHVPAIITRSNNVYGPCQYPEKIIPKFICRLLEKQTCLVHGDGSNSRRYLYINDVMEAFDVILHRGKVGEVYNIGTDDEITNIQLAQKLMELFEIPPQDRPSYIEHVVDRKFNDRRYAIDSTKLHEFGWRPMVGLEDGLKRTMDWYREHANGWWEDMACVNVAHSTKHPRDR